MLEPSFAISFKQIKDKFIAGTVEISAESSVILGGNAIPEPKAGLIINGTLIARNKINFFDHFSEDFITFEAVEPSDAEIYQIRGYKIKK